MGKALIAPIKIRKIKHRNKDGGMPRWRPSRRKNYESDEVMNIAYRLCGDRVDTIKIAKTFLSLKQLHAGLTLPEGIMYSFLQAQQINFVYQQTYASGRVYFGGNVIDFWLPDYGNAIRIQGNYWHQLPRRREEDLIDESLLIGTFIDGVRVDMVTDVWESRLLACNRENVMREAVNGVEVGQ